MPDFPPIASIEQQSLESSGESNLHSDVCKSGDQATTTEASIELREAYLSVDSTATLSVSGTFFVLLFLELGMQTI